MIFHEFLKKNHDLIDRELALFFDAHNLQTADKFIRECYLMIKEYTLCGGKRLRPTALMLAYLATGGREEKKIILPAIAIELHQAYTLIIDDIMDEDDYRRGNIGINKKLKDHFIKNYKDEIYNGNLFSSFSSRFAVSFAIMLGNITNILSKKAILISDFPDQTKVKALEAIEKADELIYHGQMSDVLMANKHSASEEKYLEMIKNKTAVFFGMALELGCLFSGADEKTTKMLKSFGIESGIAFQIQDDLLDLTPKKGHEIGSDLKKGKMTLLMIKAFEKASREQNNILSSVYGKNGCSEEEIRQIIGIMHDTGALDYCKMLSAQKNRNAKNILKGINMDRAYVDMFYSLADFMLE